MAEPAQETRKNAYEDSLVVDLDVHVMRPDAVQKDKSERMEMPWKNVVDPDLSGSVAGAYPTSGTAVEIPEEWDGVTMSDKGGLADPDEDIRETLVKDFGVDHPVINMGAQGVNLIPEKERRVDEMRATNDVLLDRFLDDNPDFFGVASVATSMPGKAAEEIDRLADEDQIVGLYANSAYIDPPLGDDKYDIMFRAAEDNDMSFVLHSGVSSPHYPTLDRSFAKFLPMHSFGHPASHMIQLLSIIYEGVPVKFPDVNFIFTEAGIGWAAYLIGRMNREVPERKFEAPLLEESPEYYVRKNCYFGNQPLEEYEDPTLLRNTIDTLGPECITFASDYPHFDFDYPSMTAKHYEDLTKDDRDQIFHGNAIDALDMPIDV